MHRAHTLHGLRRLLCGGLPGCVRGRLWYCRKGVPFVAVPASPHSTVVAQRDSDHIRVAGVASHRCSDLNNLATHFRFRVHFIFLSITTLAGYRSAGLLSVASVLVARLGWLWFGMADLIRGVSCAIPPIPLTAALLHNCTTDLSAVIEKQLCSKKSHPPPYTYELLASCADVQLCSFWGYRGDCTTGRCPLRGVAAVAGVAVASAFCPVAKQQRNRPFKNPCLGLLPLQPCYSYFRYTCYT